MDKESDFVYDPVCWEATYSDGNIVIRFNASKLPVMVSSGWASDALPPLKVDSCEEFARELCTALNAEDDTGKTLVHQLLDDAILNAIENGAFGVSEITEDEAEELAASFQS